MKETREQQPRQYNQRVYTNQEGMMKQYNLRQSEIKISYVYDDDDAHQKYKKHKLNYQKFRLQRPYRRQIKNNNEQSNPIHCKIEDQNKIENSPERVTRSYVHRNQFISKFAKISQQLETLNTGITNSVNSNSSNSDSISNNTDKPAKISLKFRIKKTEDPKPTPENKNFQLESSFALIEANTQQTEHKEQEKSPSILNGSMIQNIISNYPLRSKGQSSQDKKLTKIFRTLRPRVSPNQLLKYSSNIIQTQDKLNNIETSQNSPSQSQQTGGSNNFLIQIEEEENKSEEKEKKSKNYKNEWLSQVYRDRDADTHNRHKEVEGDQTENCHQPNSDDSRGEELNQIKEQRNSEKYKSGKESDSNISPQRILLQSLNEESHQNSSTVENWEFISQNQSNHEDHFSSIYNYSGLSAQKYRKKKLQKFVSDNELLEDIAAESQNRGFENEESDSGDGELDETSGKANSCFKKRRKKSINQTPTVRPPFVVEKVVMVDPSISFPFELKRYGCFEFDDKPENILQLNHDLENNMICLVQWKTRTNGFKPLPSYVEGSQFKDRWPGMMIDFYEKRIQN